MTSVVALPCLLAVWVTWRRRPFRRDLLLIAVALPVGVAAQAVWGGFTVIFDLAPGWVIMHFLLSMLLLVANVALAWRATFEPGSRPPARDRVSMWSVRLLVLPGFAALTGGTIVTAAGPHAGGAGTGDVVERITWHGPGDTLSWAIERHSTTGTVLGLASVGVWFLVRRRDNDPLVRRAMTAVCLLMACQGAVGALQWQLALPPGLVWVHVLLATTTWIALLRGVRRRRAHQRPLTQRGRAAGAAARHGVVSLPLPPVEMRQLVGPTDEEAFDNPDGALVFPGLDTEAVLDFGCGCGRLARQLLQQPTPPARYLGIDLHRGMIEWCGAHLAPAAPGFRFEHHDVYSAGLNPGEKPSTLPFPVADEDVSLVIACSVFTHLVEDQAVHYLRECRRVLRPGGSLWATFFLFEKAVFPMMQAFQNTLYINVTDPTNATIFDRQWLLGLLDQTGLKLVDVEPPSTRGFHWFLTVARSDDERAAVELPPDEAPVGIVRPPLMPEAAYEIGVAAESPPSRRRRWRS